jgi:hypothetical protein
VASCTARSDVVADSHKIRNRKNAAVRGPDARTWKAGTGRTVWNKSDKKAVEVEEGMRLDEDTQYIALIAEKQECFAKAALVLSPPPPRGAFGD